VSWRRENYAVLPTGGSQYRGNILTIPSVSKDDRGTYYCVAENGVGKGKRRNIAVEVEFAPVITVPRYKKGNKRPNRAASILRHTLDLNHYHRNESFVMTRHELSHSPLIKLLISARESIQLPAEMRGRRLRPLVNENLSNRVNPSVKCLRKTGFLSRLWYFFPPSFGLLHRVCFWLLRLLPEFC
jgi:hypothetical protein